MKFSERLSDLRKRKGLSQEALAEQLGVSRQAVSKWENGEAMPELSKLELLCRIFEVSPNDLMGYEESRGEESPSAKTEKSRNGNQRAVFWLVIGCMGFVVTAFCLCWSIANPVIYNGNHGLTGSLQGNDCMELFIIGCIVTVVGLLESYFAINGKGKFILWMKKSISAWLHEIMKDGNAL